MNHPTVEVSICSVFAVIAGIIGAPREIVMFFLGIAAFFIGIGYICDAIEKATRFEEEDDDTTRCSS